MPIEIRPTGQVQAYAGAGQIIGQAERAKEERARAERLRAEQAARDWELQKMAMRSQQEFAHEQRMRQAELDAEARSQEWQVEKMELASRIDFQRQEQERQRQLSIIDNDITAQRKYLKDNSIIEGTDEYDTIQANIDRLEQEKHFIELGMKPPVSIYAEKEKSLLDRLRPSAELPTQKESTKPLTKDMFEQAKKENQVIVRNTKTKEIGKLPNDEVASEVAKGNVEIISEELLFPTISFSRTPSLYEMEEAAKKGMTYLKNKSTEKFELKPIEEVKDAVKSGKYEIASPHITPEISGKPYKYSATGSFFF